VRGLLKSVADVPTGGLFRASVDLSACRADGVPQAEEYLSTVRCLRYAHAVERRRGPRSVHSYQ
jgi:hypothetical protein